MIRDFQLLIDMSGGLCFVHVVDGTVETSPILEAMRYSTSFSMFRAALVKIGIDIRDSVHEQIELQPNGWTTERLLSLCLDDTAVERKRTTFGDHKRCKLCKRWLQDPGLEELAWKRRVKRIGVGVELDAPLSEEEVGAQKRLDDLMEDAKNGICLRCHWKKQETRRWNPFG
jgi:hypothetical protein